MKRFVIRQNSNGTFDAVDNDGEFKTKCCPTREAAERYIAEWQGADRKLREVSAWLPKPPRRKL